MDIISSTSNQKIKQKQPVKSPFEQQFYVEEARGITANLTQRNQNMSVFASIQSSTSTTLSKEKPFEFLDLGRFW
jgi:hypothetical protein